MSKLTRAAGGFESFITRLSQFLIGVCAVILFAAMIIICLEVSLRYIFRTSTIWSFEFIEYIMVGLAVLGLAYIQTQGKHIKIEFIFDRFKPRAQAATTIFTTIIALVIFILFTLAGWHAAWEAWTLDVRSWSVFAIPQFPVRVMVPIGGFLMCLYLLIQLSRNILLLKERAKSAD